MITHADSLDSASNASRTTMTTTTMTTTMMPERKQDTWLMSIIDGAFRSLGRFVANHAISVLIFMTIVAIATSASMTSTAVNDNVRTGYTPLGARSHSEMLVYEDFFRNGGQPLVIYVLVLAKDGGNMLRIPQMNATVQLLRYLSRNFSVSDESTNQSISFLKYCKNFCNINEPVNMFYNSYVVQEDRVRNGEQPNSRIKLGYPTMSVLGRDMPLGPFFFGAELWMSNDTSTPVHKRPSDIKYLKMILLQFRLEKPANVTPELLRQYELGVVDYLNYEYQSEVIRPLGLSDALISVAIVESGMAVLPYLFTGFVLMIIFAVSTVSVNAAYMNQLNWQKPVIAVLACVSPMLACGCAMGTLFWLGARNASILAVTPFLVLAIGVDDAFLMIHSWQRIAKRLRKSPMEGDSVSYRMSEVYGDIGPSITITSLTNALAFGVGLFTPTPDIQLFCAMTALGMIVDFLFQVTWFGALLALLGQKEMNAAGEQRAAKDKQIENDVAASLPSGHLRVPLRRRAKASLGKFASNYSRWLSSKFTLITILLLLFVYWYISYIGARKIEPKLTPEKLFLKGSVLTEINSLREKYVWSHYTVATVFINNPGNLSDPQRLTRLNRLVYELEHFPESLGARSSQYWLRDYETFTKFTADSALDYDYAPDTDAEDAPPTVSTNASTTYQWRYSPDDLESFLAWPEFQYWAGFIQYTNATKIGKYELKRFFLQVAFRGDQLRDWATRAELLNRWRAVIDKYSDLGASVFEDDAHFLDQIGSLVSTTTQTCLVTLLVMVVVCTMFMWNVMSVVVASCAIVSICAGVFGMLSWWNMDLDPITMTTMIMSIGFSVDFTAHVSYHFHRTGVESHELVVTERLTETLVAVGWPMLQAGLSTVLSVFCMIFVDSYMSEVFVKTIFLVVFLGFVHGLVIVPAVLAALPTITCCRSKIKTSSSPSSEPSSVRTTTRSSLVDSPYLRRLFFSNKIQPETAVTDKEQHSNGWLTKSGGVILHRRAAT